MIRLIVITIGLLALGILGARADEPFGKAFFVGKKPSGIFGDKGNYMIKWDRAKSQIAIDENILRMCETAKNCPAAAKRYRSWVEAAKKASRGKLLTTLNTTVNQGIRHQFEKDGDIWKSPLETLREGGDCEDFAILKMELLKMAGVPAADLRIVVGNRDGQGHTVLAVKQDEKWLILDNLTSKIRSDKKYKLRPHYLVGETGFSIHLPK